MERDIIVFRGVNFIRYPESKVAADARYYKGRWRINGRLVKTTLHRAMWIDAYGSIPEGCHIHHKDENHLNNSLDNFECITSAQHLSDHYQSKSDEYKAAKTATLLTVAQDAAKAWHRTEEGRAWHRSHAQQILEKHTRTLVCPECRELFETNAFSKVTFCSRKCKGNFNNRLPENVERRRLYAQRKRDEAKAAK